MAQPHWQRGQLDGGGLGITVAMRQRRRMAPSAATFSRGRSPTRLWIGRTTAPATQLGWWTRKLVISLGAFWVVVTGCLQGLVRALRRSIFAVPPYAICVRFRGTADTRRPEAAAGCDANDPNRTQTVLGTCRWVAKYWVHPLTDPRQFDILRCSLGL
jgi:hypothetical protein